MNQHTDEKPNLSLNALLAVVRSGKKTFPRQYTRHLQKAVAWWSHHGYRMGKMGFRYFHMFLFFADSEILPYCLLHSRQLLIAIETEVLRRRNCGFILVLFLKAEKATKYRKCKHTLPKIYIYKEIYFQTLLPSVT